ncbi:hypothetical protein MTR67_020219 [Solanum verrucosum]|uniref:Reverse transcriptase zinc-binding domain-containing protein n=1 Tax=Solanum verrucosum TaxID=315347 RepID=A0AAF0QMW2_SOLVR|nr:hypothetical protein MTR67_020219 [Solanum verrucosum]
MDPNFHYHPRCKAQKIVQLSFVDDLLLFCRGDIKSVKCMNQCFMQFSQASGTLPFRYLGVPLSAKRVTLVQCKPLMKKMLGRITNWTTKFLSYASRAQPIKSVLYAIQMFWSQIFALPKKIIQEVEAMCRRFLWTGNLETSEKALIAWDKLCWPKSNGGLQFLDIYTWNKAAIGKLLWNVCPKKDKLWVAWIHSYYGQNGVWNIPEKQASWVVQRILKAAQHLQEAGNTEAYIRDMEKYSIGKVYLQMRVNGRLATKDGLAKWGMIQSPLCPLCQRMNEDHDHLFFQCSYSAEVWSKILNWQGIDRGTMHWTAEVQWAIKHMKGKGSTALVYKMAMASSLYYI